MCLGEDRMRLGPARPALASPALAGLCRVHAAFSYRDSPAGVPPAGRPLLRCWSLLLTCWFSARSHRNAGGREGVGKGALCLFSVLCSRRRTVADSPLQYHPVRPGQDAKFAQGTTPPACLDWGHGAVGGRHCLGLAHARFPSTWP
jgi:hypothetical protein